MKSVNEEELVMKWNQNADFDEQNNEIMLPA